MLRHWIVMPAVAAVLASCGSAAVISTSAPDVASATPVPPSYEQVLDAIAGARSVHEIKKTAEGTTDIRADSAGTVAGTFTFAGVGSLQVFANATTFEARDALPDIDIP